MHAPEDQALLQRTLGQGRSGMRELADRLIEPIQREVSLAILRATRGTGLDPRQEVLDLVQDVLVLLFENDARELRRWDPSRGRGLDSYVRLVARRRVARVLSQRRGNPFALVLVEDPPEATGDTDDSAWSQLEHRDQLDRVLMALYARMDARDHELFDLLFVEERDPAEVATLVGLSRGAVNAWAYRTRRIARALVDAVASSAATSTPKEEVGRGG